MCQIFKANANDTIKTKVLTTTQKFTQEKLEPLAEFQSSVLSYMSVSRDATGYYHCKVQTTEPAYRIFSSTAHVVVSSRNVISRGVTSYHMV